MNLNGSVKVALPNGERVDVKLTGETKINEQISLKNVLYLPDFNCNLVSISKLARELNCSVVFLPHGCFVQDLTTKRVIAAGELKGNLYYLDQGAEGQVNAASSSMTEILHQRLGHIPLRRLKFVFDDVNASENEHSVPCDTCHRAKQCQSISFSK